MRKYPSFFIFQKTLINFWQIKHFSLFLVFKIFFNFILLLLFSDSFFFLIIHINFLRLILDFSILKFFTFFNESKFKNIFANLKLWIVWIGFFRFLLLVLINNNLTLLFLFYQTITLSWFFRWLRNVFTLFN